MYDFLFEVVSEYSELCGEQFFVECNTVAEAWQTVAEIFGIDIIINEEIKCVGKYTPEEAEILGYDTY